MTEIRKNRIRTARLELPDAEATCGHGDGLRPNCPRTGHIMRRIADNVDPVRGKLLPVTIPGPSFGVRTKFVADR